MIAPYLQHDIKTLPTFVNLTLDEGSLQPGMSGDYVNLPAGAGRAFEIWPIILQKAYMKEFGLGAPRSAAAVWRHMGLGRATWYEWNTDATVAQSPRAYVFLQDGSGFSPQVPNTESLAFLVTAAQCNKQKLGFASAEKRLDQGGLATWMNVMTNGVNYQIRREHAYVIESVDGDVVKLYDPANEATDNPNAPNNHTLYLTMADLIWCGRAVTLL